MQITDPDMRDCIRNAANAKHATVDIPASKMKKANTKYCRKRDILKLSAN